MCLLYAQNIRIWVKAHSHTHYISVNGRPTPLATNKYVIQCWTAPQRRRLVWCYYCIHMIELKCDSIFLQQVRIPAMYHIPQLRSPFFRTLLLPTSHTTILQHHQQRRSVLKICYNSFTTIITTILCAWLFMVIFRKLFGFMKLSGRWCNQY